MKWGWVLAGVLLLLLVARVSVPVTPCYGGPGRPTRALVQEVVTGTRGFRLEYGALPLSALDTSDERTPARTRGTILQVLLGRHPAMNPRAIPFLDPPLAKNGKTGLFIEADGTPVLRDQWGQPLYLMFDLNGDHRIPNPDTRPGEPTELAADVIAFSAGPDRDPNTWKDNITSW